MTIGLLMKSLESLYFSCFLEFEVKYILKLLKRPEELESTNF